MKEAWEYLFDCVADPGDRIRRFVADLGREVADMVAEGVLQASEVTIAANILRTELTAIIAEWPHLDDDQLLSLKDLAEEAFLARVRLHLNARRKTA